MQVLRNVTLAVTLTISGSPCFGQGTIYFDRGAFDLAVASMDGIRIDVNFEPPLPPGGIDSGTGGVQYFSPVTISGLTFRGGGSLIIYRGVGLNNWDSLAPLAVDMNGPALAFGADFSSYLSFVTSFQATVTLNDGRVSTFIAPAAPNFTFFAFVTTQPFSSLTFSDGGLIGFGLHEEILDNITVVRVPEPGVFALLALGALLLGWRWHKFWPSK